MTMRVGIRKTTAERALDAFADDLPDVSYTAIRASRRTARYAAYCVQPRLSDGQAATTAVLVRNPDGMR